METLLRIRAKYQAAATAASERRPVNELPGQQPEQSSRFSVGDKRPLNLPSDPVSSTPPSEPEEPVISINNTSRRRNKRPRTSSPQGILKRDISKRSRILSPQGTPQDISDRLRTIISPEGISPEGISPEGISTQDISKRLRITTPEAQGLIEHLRSRLPPLVTW